MSTVGARFVTLEEFVAVNGPLRFTVLGHPQPGGSKRAFHHKQTGRVLVTDANPKAKPWQALVAAAAHDAMNGGQLLTGPLEVHLTFYSPRPQSHYGTGRNQGQVRSSAPPFPAGRPDVLKLARSTEDALTSVCWRDDAQIVTEVLAKRYGEPARADIIIHQIT